MKKLISLFAALLLAVAAPLTVLAEDTEMSLTFEGLVTEIFDGGFLMEDKNMGLIQVNTDDNTVLDGILSIQPLEVGMYVLVDHTGMMTRSIPPQVYGMRVGCYTLNGVAGEITEEGVLLTGDPIFGEVFVQMTPTMANVFPGVPMLVYYDGVMTMSLPGKVNARYVVVPELTGVVSDKDGAGFTLTDEDGNAYRVLTSDTLLVGQLAMNEDDPLPGSPEAEALAVEGSEVVVDEAVAEKVAEDGATEVAEEVAVTDEAATEETVAEDAADVTAASDEAVAEEAAAEEAVTGEAAEEATAEDTAEEALAEPDDDTAPDSDLLQDVTIPTGDEVAAPAVQWGDGDTVTVYHQGPMEPEAGSEVIALGLLVHR